MTDQAPPASVLLERAVVRISQDDAFVGALFRRWCGDSLDLDAVAASLACDRADVVRAGLCRSPREESFRADVAAIAGAAGIEEYRLAALLRESASIGAFRRSTGTQLLAAARDVPDTPEEPK